MAKQLARAQVVRPGEGALVDIAFLPEKEVSGQGATTFQISLTNVPVPSKQYSADCASVELIDEIVYFFFAQKRVRTDVIRSLVIVKMELDWAKRFLRSVETATHSFDKYAVENKIQAAKLKEIDDEPKDTVAFDANFTLAALSGKQACLDFMFSSPFAFSASMGAKKLAVDPVLRVNLHGSVLMGLLEGLRGIVGDMRDDEFVEVDHE